MKFSTVPWLGGFAVACAATLGCNTDLSGISPDAFVPVVRDLAAPEGSDLTVPVDATMSLDSAQPEDDMSECAPTCMTDQDCVNSCAPPPDGAVNCCDGRTHTCYTANLAMCPLSPIMDLGQHDGMYH